MGDWSSINKDLIENIGVKRLPPSAYVKMTPEELLFSLAVDGIVYDEEKAKQGPCECVKTPNGELCWDKGIIGALNKDQFKKYCNEDNIKWKAMPAKLQNRFQTFADASKECEIGKDNIKTLEDRLVCMHLKAQEHE